LFRGAFWSGKGGRDSGETLMGARVVGGGGIGAGDGSLATVVGSWTGGRCGSTVGIAADVSTADVLTVAGKTGTGLVDITGDIAVDTGVDGGAESLGVTISCVRWAGWSSIITVAAATAIVARTAPVRTSRLDHRLSSSGCSGARGATSWLSPADSSTSSGSNK
jgi:hypothetical protein